MSKHKGKDVDEKPFTMEEERNQSGSDKDLMDKDAISADAQSKLSQQLEEQKDKFIRLLAEFENYKRRTSKERIEILKVAGQDVIADLLPALDDIDRAEQVMQEANDIDAIREGLNLISEKIKSILKAKGLENIVKKGDTFDTETMEAISELESGEEFSGKVVEVLVKGYTLNDKIIRYAKVVVGK